MTDLDLMGALLPAYKPFPNQARFHASDKPIRVFASGGRGSGCTTVAVHEALRLAMTNAGSAGLLCGATAPEHQFLADALFSALRRNEVAYKRNSISQEVYLPAYGSEIILCRLPKLEKIAGVSLSWVGVDDPVRSLPLGEWRRLVAAIRRQPHRGFIATPVTIWLSNYARAHVEEVEIIWP